ncbi:MAG: hypothetical protein H6Q89_3002 [Myxococcaceae bacterium]|nr:hypothetical protein [Myxococcaceae bacterium]
MIRRVLLVVPLVSTLACVTIDGPRRAVSERWVETRCEGRPAAVLDGMVRDRVRLVFSDSEHCTEIKETSYVKERRQRLSDPVRGGFAAGAGLIVAVPLVALAVVGGRPAVNRSPGLEYPQPVYPSVPSALGEPVMYAILAAGIGTGLGAWEAMKATDPAGSIEVAERTTTVTMRQRVVKRGTVNAPGLAVGGLQLTAGALELSLEEAQGLANGELYLDGARVELSGDTSERLGFLPICKAAIDGYDEGLPSWNSSRRVSAWRQAQTCDRHGWTFAEQVRATAIAAAP